MLPCANVVFEGGEGKLAIPDSVYVSVREVTMQKISRPQPSTTRIDNESKGVGLWNDMKIRIASSSFPRIWRS